MNKTAAKPTKPAVYAKWSEGEFATFAYHAILIAAGGVLVGAFVFQLLGYGLHSL